MEAVAYRDIEPGEELSISCKPSYCTTSPLALKTAPTTTDVVK